MPQIPLTSQDQQAIIDLHNKYRSDPQISTPNVAWDDTLVAGAQDWANQLAQTGQWDHSPDAKAGNVGENIAKGTGSPQAAQLADGWKTDEQPHFKPGIYPDVSKDGHTVGHYTQLIWRATTRVGCGFATDGTTTYLVCRYMVAGNKEGVGVPSPQPLTLAQISALDANNVFGVDAANNVYWCQFKDGTWTRSSITGKQMTQVSVASDLTFCGLDTNGAIWQGSLMTSPFIWTAVPMPPPTLPSAPSAFISLSCGSATNLLAVGVNCWTYRYDGSSWTRVPGGGEKMISVASSDGAYWALDTHGRLWGPGGVVGGDYWVSISVSVGSDTNRWAVGTDGQYWKVDMSDPNKWTWAKAAPGTGKQVSVASSDGTTVWTVGTDNRVSRLMSNAWTPILM